MKQFEEDKDSKETYPHKINGPSDPTLIDQLEKLESSVPFKRFKRYISDIKLAHTIKKKHSSKTIDNIASEYSEDALTVDNIEKEEEEEEDEKRISLIEINQKEMLDNSKQEIEKDTVMELNITGSIVMKFIFPYVKYEINIYEKENNESKTVYRRYCEFENLRISLVNKYVCMYTPPLPGKKLLGYFDKNLIEKRKKFLQIFLHELQYLFYYFYDSPEIKTFLDPSVQFYCNNTIPHVSSIITMDHDESLIHLSSYANKAKKTFSYSLQNIHDKIVSTLREPYISHPNPDLIANAVIKNYPRKILKKSQEKINAFYNKLNQHRNIVNDIYTIVENISNNQKEYQSIEKKFNEQLLLFESEYISNISFGKITINSIETKEISEQIKTVAKERPIVILTQNLSDWIFRENTIIMSYCECINSLNYFIRKDKTIKTQMKVMKQLKNKARRKEELGKLSKLNHLLNEILIMNTIYIHDVRIDRYTYSRFQLYYNALKFSFSKHEENLELLNKLYDLIGNHFKKLKHITC